MEEEEEKARGRDGRRVGSRVGRERRESKREGGMETEFRVAFAHPIKAFSKDSFVKHCTVVVVSLLPTIPSA